MMLKSYSDIADPEGVKQLLTETVDSSIVYPEIFRTQGKQIREERCAWLADFLCRRLQRFVNGDEQATLLRSHHEVIAVREDSSGPIFCEWLAMSGQSPHVERSPDSAAQSELP